MVTLEDQLNKHWIAVFSAGWLILILVAATLVPSWAAPTTHHLEGQMFFIFWILVQVSHVAEGVLGRVREEEETRPSTVIIGILWYVDLRTWQSPLSGKLGQNDYISHYYLNWPTMWQKQGRKDKIFQITIPSSQQPLTNKIV